MSDHRFVGTEFKGALGVAVTEDEQNFRDVAFCTEATWQKRIVAALNAVRGIDTDTLRTTDFAKELALPKDTTILIVGDAVDGFEFHGPFETADAAVEYGERNANTLGQWVIAPLTVFTP